MIARLALLGVLLGIGCTMAAAGDTVSAAQVAPRIESLSVSARTIDRQTLVIEVELHRPPQRSRHDLRCTVTDPQGNVQAATTRQLTARRQSFTMTIASVPPGSHYLQAEVTDRGQVVDSARRYFRSLPTDERPYLNLISFYSSRVRNGAEGLRALNGQAFDGVALPLWGAYHHEPIEAFDALCERFADVPEVLEIHPWPWLFLNRMLGLPPEGRRHESIEGTRPEYFARIPTIDLDNTAGAREDFLTMWRHSLRLARRWGAPGVVLDYENYNNYDAYDLQYVARQRGETCEAVAWKLYELGRDMARAIEEEYPEAVVWTLISALQRFEDRPGCSVPIYHTPGYISIGLLDYAAEHDLPCVLVNGGEGLLQYYHPDLAAWRERIRYVDDRLAPAQERWPRNFDLAGCISPYHDAAQLTGWIAQKAGDAPRLRDIDDFVPIFRELMVGHRYVWVYAASASNTNPYDPEIARIYSDALEEAMREAFPERPTQ